MGDRIVDDGGDARPPVSAGDLERRALDGQAVERRAQGRHADAHEEAGHHEGQGEVEECRATVSHGRTIVDATTGVGIAVSRDAAEKCDRPPGRSADPCPNSCPAVT